MIQQIIDGIISALRTSFHEVTHIYTEKARQGFKEPCFVLRLLNPNNEQFLGNRYYRANLFSVQFIPKCGMDAKAECYDVNDRLFRALEYIMVGGDLQRGTNMNGEYFDDTLSFFVNFNMFITIEPKLDPMEQLTVENQAK